MAGRTIFGAPTSDPGGTFAANIHANSQAAAMEVQAVQQAGQMVLGSLNAVMELRARRDSQMREIEAQNTLERLRQNSQDLREKESRAFTAAENDKEAQRREAESRRERATRVGLAVLGERGATSRAKLGEAGANRRADLGESGANSRFQAGLGFQRQRASTEDFQWNQSFQESRRGNDLRNQQTAEELRAARERHLEKQRLDQYKQMAYELAAQGGFQKDPLTGAVSFDPQAIQSMIGAYAPSPLNPEDPRVDAARAPGAGYSVADELQSLYGAPNDIATKSATLGLEAGRGQGALSGTPPPGKFDVTPDVLEDLVKNTTNPKDKSVLSGILSAANSGNGPQFSIRNGKLEFSGGGLNERGRALLESWASTPGASEAIVGRSMAPAMGTSEQGKYGANVLGTGRASGRTPAAEPAPAAPESAPSGAMEQPAPQQEAPQQTAEPQMYRRDQIPSQTGRDADGQSALMESQANAGVARALAKYGVSVGSASSVSGAPKGEAAPVPNDSSASRSRGFTPPSSTPPGKAKAAPAATRNADADLIRELIGNGRYAPDVVSKKLRAAVDAGAYNSAAQVEAAWREGLISAKQKAELDAAIGARPKHGRRRE